MKTKYLILGAGPAGLSFANRIMQLGEADFVVLEKEQEPGGLCRSKDVDGAALDIGGGHFLDVRRKEVNDFLFGFMPEEEWDIYSRDSRIEVYGAVIGHPFEANIWQMPEDKQIAYLKSIAVAGCNLGQDMPKFFVDWIKWKLGDKIAEDYMIPYNSKMFGDNLDQLGTYWLEKLPNVSFDETLLSCLHRKPYGTQPGHAQFYYPKKCGYGELWLRMGKALGEKLVCDAAVKTVDFDKKTVELCNGEKYEAEYIITTIPWTSFEYIGMPKEIEKSIQELKYTSVVIEYHPENMETAAHWIYYPDKELSYHRILVRHNFLKDSKGYWTETNSERFTPQGNDYYKNEYAYPLNTITKPEVMKNLLAWSKSKNVIGLGRWGEWEHYNSDVTVSLAMKLAEEMIQC